MIEFLNNSQAKPYSIFQNLFLKAKDKKQDHIDAVCISSYSLRKNEVDSRYVNLKVVDNINFIFFSNYSSPKSEQFESHNQISMSIFWSSINVQIRMKGQVKKTSMNFNQTYFENRSSNKNALAISSNQSKKINSYKEVKEKYTKVLKTSDLKKCPNYWGGFEFTPYSFEFWHGNESRINYRELFILKKNDWQQFILEP